MFHTLSELQLALANPNLNNFETLMNRKFCDFPECKPSKDVIFLSNT